MNERKKLCRPSNDNDLSRDPFKATKIWNELIEHLRTSVEQRRRRWKFQYYENCFRGGDVVEVLHTYVHSNPDLSKDATRSQVRSLCQILLEKKVIECVTSDGGSSKSKRDSFEDGNKLYRFSPGPSKHVTSSPNSQTERKINGRRSLLGRGDKRITRRMSLNFTPSAQKRLADILLMPSSTLQSPEVHCLSSLEVPKKRRRLSLDVGLGIRYQNKDYLKFMFGLVMIYIFLSKHLYSDFCINAKIFIHLHVCTYNKLLGSGNLKILTNSAFFG